ncbi:glycosyltransferase family 87 protein [Galactobacter valiniphilus]|uniref:glycosyltransferase family 87 protein n=1 Tax=Galactobacter valiniphilus TaxID=2676122 RepID=UPI0018F4C5EA|nr:glycosyltransferase 87 family protein [Galactobacter valiniphilus]
MSSQDPQGHHRRGPLRITVPSRNDAFLRSLVGAIGGPLGRRTEPGVVSPGFWRVERVLLVIVTVFGLLAVLSKDVCRQNGWGGAQNAFVGMCYSDWTALWGGRGFAADPWAPFTGSSGEPFEYPVLMSGIASVVSLLVPRSLEPGQQLLAYFDINTFLAVALWAVVVLAVAKSSGRRIWDAAIVAASPAMLFALTVNWDMWAVAMLALGLLALGREHPWLAGALIGLGAATKLYPALALGALLVIAIRTGIYKPFFKVAAGAAAAWLVVNVPFAIASFDRWWTFYSFSGSRGAGNSSVYQAWDLSVGRWLPALQTTPSAITIIGFAAFALACLGILALGITAPQPPRVASLVFLVVAAFVLVGKVYSPQFVLWLVPLAALAYPRWRALLTWQLFEVAHFAGIWMYLYMHSGDENAKGRFPDELFVLLILGHMVSLGWICFLVVRSVLRPETDPVRRVGLVDPLGGLFAGRDAYPPKRPAPAPMPGARHAAPLTAPVAVPVGAVPLGAGAPAEAPGTPPAVVPSLEDAPSLEGAADAAPVPDAAPAAGAPSPSRGRNGREPSRGIIPPGHDRAGPGPIAWAA